MSSSTAPGSSKNHPKPPPLDPKLFAKIRKYVQHDPVVRCGVPDPQEIKSVREYWSSRRSDVIESFLPLGQAAAPLTHMLHHRSQAFIRRLVKIEYDLAEEGYCFQKLTPSSFVVDEHTGVPLISTAAVGDIVAVKPADKKAMIGANMKYLAELISEDIIGKDNAMPEEVEQGLLKMMREKGYRRRYVIVNHVSLVPIENRLDLNLRMFQHLYGKIAQLSKKDRDQVQRELLFPKDWHTQVQNNSHLAKIYYGKVRYRTRHNQAWMAHRFNRNAAEHALQNSVNVAKMTWEYTRPDVARMLYAIFPLFLRSLMRELDRLRLISEIEIESLFAYRE